MNFNALSFDHWWATIDVLNLINVANCLEEGESLIEMKVLALAFVVESGPSKQHSN